MKRARKQAVTLVTRTPDKWLQQARDWGIDPRLMTPDNIHRLVQAKMHINNAPVPAPPLENKKEKQQDQKMKLKLPADLMPLSNKLDATELCGKCMRKVTPETVQNRSADEASTVVYHCNSCGKTYLYNHAGSQREDDEPEELRTF